MYKSVSKDSMTGKFETSFSYSPKNDFDVVYVPCRNCINCRLADTRDWGFRLWTELMFCKQSAFLTITYDPECIPDYGSLVKQDLRRFHKANHKSGLRYKYYQCGEYGSQGLRPHYHMIMLDYWPDDARPVAQSGSHVLYTSAKLNARWGKGQIMIGQVTQQSIMYCTKYCTKKKTGALAKLKYARHNEVGEIFEIEPEFHSMSPRIGRLFYEEYFSDIYPLDYVVNGSLKKQPVPTVFDKWLEQDNPQLLEELKVKRIEQAQQRIADNTEERSYQKQQCAIAKSDFFSKEVL